MLHRLAALLTSGLLLVAPAAAQPSSLPMVSPEFLDQSRDINDDEILFCLNTTSALVEMDREIAQAIGDALLLNVRFHEVKSPFVIKPYDFRIPLSERDLFVTITNNCQAFMGVRLVPGQIPQWMTVSTPYYASRSVMATTDPAITGFADIAAGSDIGSRLGSPGDAQFSTYLRSLGESGRPRRIPYPSNDVLLERLAEGSVDTVFIWEPALYLAGNGDPASLGIAATFPPPFSVPAIEFGVALLSQDTFVRGLIDEAIVALRADGTLADIIDAHAIPRDRP